MLAFSVATAYAPAVHRKAASPVLRPVVAPECSLRVTASAYNSLPAQTDSLPNQAAWGDSLYPGLRAIAVSRDLIPMGLGKGAIVRIEDLSGEFTVLDKMHSRWRKRIDVYFGIDEKAARAWGRQKVIIRWRDNGTGADTGYASAAELRAVPVANPRTPS